VKRRRVPAPGPDRPHVIASDDRQQRPKASKANYESSQGETPVNRQIRVGLAMVAAAALGAAAVQTLHAQAKPPAYNIAEITTKEQDGYNKEYLPLVTKAPGQPGR
jgi:hypothetical protein